MHFLQTLSKNLVSSVSPSAVQVRWTFATLIAAYTLLLFASGSPTAFEWPAIDMAPFFERVKDPNFVPGDFFTNASLDSSPRQVFGYGILNLAEWLHTSWYAVFFGVKVLVVIGTPFLLFVLLHSSPVLTNATAIWSALGLAFAVVTALSFPAASAVAVAWWKPLHLCATPHGLSITLGLASAVAWGSTRPRQLAGILFLVASVWIHPICALLTGTFAWIVRPKQSLRAETLLASVGTLSILAVSTWFRASHDLGTEEFVDIYARLAHPQHYVPSEYMALDGSKWWMAWLRIQAVLGLTVGYALIRSRTRLLQLSLSAWFAYSGAVFLQWGLVELLPVKSIAILGPSRFTMFGFWLASLSAVGVAVDILIGLKRSEERERWALTLLWIVAVVWVLLALSGKSAQPEVWGRYSFKRAAYLGFGVFSVCLLFPLWRPNFFSGRSWPTFLGVLSLIPAWAIASYGLLDQPLQARRAQRAGLYAWIESRTPADSVFAVYPSSLVAELPLAGHRAVFVGNGFPFTERRILEYADRMAEIYGSLSQRRQTGATGKIDQTSAYFLSLGEKDFSRIRSRYRLDYAVVPTHSHSKLLSDGQTMVYRDEEFTVYHIPTVPPVRHTSASVRSGN